MTGRAVEIPFEPLTALAGGILAGAIVTVIAWRRLWRQVEQQAHTTGVHQ